jgi:hypothetical protein
VTSKKSKPGRPRLKPAERKSRNLTFRSRGALRQKLEDATRKSGRSVSEEIERRLEYSFRDEDVLASAADLAYGREIAALVDILGRVLDSIDIHATLAGPPKRLLHSPFWFDQATAAVCAILDRFRPSSEIDEAPKGFEKKVGAMVAQAFLQSALDPSKAARSDAAMAMRNHSRLGEELVKRVSERLAQSPILES